MGKHETMYRKELADLDAVYAVRDQRSTFASSKPKQVVDSMRAELLKRFGNMRQGNMGLIDTARILTYHLAPYERMGIVGDFEKEFHGMSREETLPDTHALHVLEGLADICTALRIGQVRAQSSPNSKRGGKKEVTKRFSHLGMTNVHELLKTIQAMGARRAAENRFDLLVAASRDLINRTQGDNGGPAIIRGVPHATPKHFLSNTGYAAAIRKYQNESRSSEKR